MTEDSVHDSDELEITEDVEQAEEQVVTSEPVRQVPLEALEAERRKRKEAEAQNKALQDYMLKSKQTSETAQDEDDEEEYMTKAEFKKRSFAQKREVLEEAFCSSNPVAVQEINKNLEEIIKQKPWLAQTIENSPNRYARAYEIVQAFKPKEKEELNAYKSVKTDVKRIVENSKKPVSTNSISKSSTMNNAEYLKSIAGTSEFREYRRKMLSGK